MPNEKQDQDRNRVWIELDPPVYPLTEERHIVYKKRAALMTEMLRKLCAGKALTTIKWFKTHKGEWTYARFERDGSFTCLEDHGYWFNLDYLGRETKTGN